MIAHSSLSSVLWFQSNGWLDVRICLSSHFWHRVIHFPYETDEFTNMCRNRDRFVSSSESGCTWRVSFRAREARDLLQGIVQSDVTPLALLARNRRTFALRNGFGCGARRTTRITTRSGATSSSCLRAWRRARAPSAAPTWTTCSAWASSCSKCSSAPGPL